MTSSYQTGTDGDRDTIQEVSPTDRASHSKFRIFMRVTHCNLLRIVKLREMQNRTYNENCG